ncbi:MAG TPA: O-antigen ligase family protein [Candidatus Paceibacterota bacterium]|nr:O-antigen ligase family protein [Candidatus Paceibacterota bacterium]
MLQKTSKFFLYASLFSVVIVMTSTFFPFIGGKDYFFRFSVELALVFFVLWWAFESRGNEVWERIKEVAKKPLAIAVTAFVTTVMLSTLFAYDMHAAFWSNYERGEGGFEMLHYYVFFALLVLLFKTRKDWRMFFKMFLVAAGCMILYGILADTGAVSGLISQYQGGTPPNPRWLAPLMARFQGSLGNPAYVAPYLMFSMFFALYLWATSTLAKWWKKALIYGLPTLIFLLFFMVTETRGAFLGLVVAIYVFLVFLGYMRTKYRWFSLGAVAAIAVLTSIFVHLKSAPWFVAIPGSRMFDLPLHASSLIALSVGGIAAAALAMFARERKQLWWVLGALVAVTLVGGIYVVGTGKVNLADPTTSTRFWTWGSAWQGIQERPITGWGLENFTTVFDKFFNPLHFIPGQNAETWFDRAHSIYFDYLTETGLLGLGTYLAIFVLLGMGIFGKAKAKVEHLSVYEKGLLLAVPVGYLIQGVAIFDVLPIYINLFAFFAFGYFCLYGTAHHAHGEATN